MKTALALAALAAAATAQPLAPVDSTHSILDLSAPLTSADKLKRATFAIDAIIARSEPICTSSSDSDTLCAQQSQALSSIAGTTLEGYGTLLARAPPGVKGWKKEKKKKLTKNLEHVATGFSGAPAGDTGSKVKRAPPGVKGWKKMPKKKLAKALEHVATGFSGAPAGDTGSKVKRAPPGVKGWRKESKKKLTKNLKHIATGFSGAPAGDTGSKVKRDAFPESLIAHCDNDADLCQVDERDPEDAYLLSKRDAEEYDVAETMQPRGVGETLIAIRDAVDVIKREAAEAGEGDDEDVEGYFEVIDEKVRRAVELLED